MAKVRRWASGGVALLLGIALAGGRPAESAPSKPGEARRAAANALFEREASEDAFREALRKAKEAGVSPQVVLEGELIRAIRTQDWDALVLLAPRMEQAAGAFDAKESRVFSSREGFDGMLQGVLAQAARLKGDAAGFEKHLKEAFWLSPQHASLYGEWCAQFRKEQRMADLVLPLDVPLSTSDGRRITLKQVLAGKKGLLVDFWASTCGPCMMLMGELKARAHKLAPQGIVVAALNAQDDAAAASAVKKEKGMDLPWLLEPGDLPYSRPLAVDTIPCMVLITPEGRILFNGHPMDPGLPKALAKLGAAL